MKPRNILLQIAIAIFGASVIAATLFIGSTNEKGIPDPIEVAGEKIEFTWTDENSQEDLIIWTDERNYNNGLSSATVYAAVVNQTNVDQEVELLAYFESDKRRIQNVSVLTDVTTTGPEVYESQCTTIKATSTEKTATDTEVCEQVLTGYGPDVVEKQWLPLETKPRDVYEESLESAKMQKESKQRKPVDGFIATKKTLNYTVPTGGVVYYRIEIEYPANDNSSFFLEAIGSEGGYGHLDPWFDANWDYRVSITIDDAQVPSTLTSFPVYVNLANLPAGFHTNVKSDGCDIRVVEADETTETAFELVVYDAASDTGELHFMADSVTGSGGGDTTFYIYYGNNAASCYADTDTFGRNAVWTNYWAVWHFQGTVGTADKVEDATGNGRNLTENGTPSSATGKLGSSAGAYDFDGNINAVSTDTGYDWLNLAGTNVVMPAIGSSAFTFQSWMNPDSLPNTAWGLLYIEENGGAGRPYARSWLGGSTGPMDGGVETSTGGSNDTPTINSAFTAGSWTFHAVGRNSSNYPFAYANGTLTTSATLESGSFSSSNAPFYINRRYNTSYGSSRRYGDGKYDEARIRLSHLTEAWLDAEYVNQNTPTTFYTVGVQETNGAAVRRIINIQ